MNKILLSLLLTLGVFAMGTSAVLACCDFADPPVITGCTADPDMLWPPNHKMKEIELAVQGTDIDDWEIIGVDPVDALGPCVDPFPADDDDVCHVGNDPDFFFDGQYLELRSERTGEFGARTYNVQVQAVNCEFDPGGFEDCEYAIAWCVQAVTVPHSMGNN